MNTNSMLSNILKRKKNWAENSNLNNKGGLVGVHLFSTLEIKYRYLITFRTVLS